MQLEVLEAEAVALGEPQRRQVELVAPEALVDLGPYYLAVLVVHDERVELVSRRWLSVICGCAEEACFYSTFVQAG